MRKRADEINTGRAFRLLWRYLIKQKGKIVAGILATFAIGITELLTGALLKFLTNTVTRIEVPADGGAIKIPVKLNLDIELFNLRMPLVDTTLKGADAVLSGIVIISLVFFLFYLLQGLFQYLREVFMNLAIERVLQNFKSDILNSAMAAPYNSMRERNTGDIISRVNYDVTVLTDTINILIEISRFIIYMVMFVPAMFLISIKFSVITVLFFPVSFIIIRIVAAVIKRSSKQVSDNVGDYNRFLDERLNRLKLIKVSGTSAAEQADFDDLVDKNYQFRKRLIKQRFFLKPSNEVLGMLVLALLFILMSKHLLAGEGNVGDIAFFLYLVKTSFKPVKKVAQAVGDLNMALISTGKIGYVFDMEREHGTEPQHPSMSPSPTLRIKNLRFGYKGKEVLKGINLEADRGDTVLIKGRTGAGKTTLCSLLPLLNEPPEGTIFIDGLDIALHDPSMVRDQISYLSGETTLIPGTVTENLLYGTGAAHKDIMDFRQLLPSWVEEEPDRFIADEEGAITSGEARRIALVRTLLRRRSIIILDEPFAYMDNHEISVFMDLIPPGSLVIVVSRNEVVAARSTKKYLLENGVLQPAV